MSNAKWILPAIMLLLVSGQAFAIMTEAQYLREQERERRCQAALESAPKQCAAEARAIARTGLIGAAVSKIRDCNATYGTNETLYRYEDCVADAKQAAAGGLIAAYEAKMANCRQMFGR